MSRLQIVKRLLWKEFREGLPVLLFAAVAPPVLFGAPPLVPRLFAYREPIGFVAAMALLAALALWVAKPDKKRRPEDFGPERLPAGPVTYWSASFLGPAVWVAAAGAWLGLWSSALFGSNHASFLALAWTVFIVALFAGLKFMASALPVWVTAPCAMAWALWACGSLLPIFRDDPAATIRWAKLTTWFNIWAGAAASVALLLFAVFRGPWAARVKRAAAIAFVVAVLPGPYAGVVGAAVKDMARPFFDYDYGAISADDGSFFLKSDTRKTPEGLVSLEFNDRRIGRTTTRLLKQRVRALGVREGRYVYLAQAAPGDLNVKVLEWDTRRDRTRVAALIPTRAASLQGRTVLEFMSLLLMDLGGQAIDPLSGMFVNAGSDRVSPSGDLLAVTLRSTAGTGNDLWMVDLRSGRSVIVLANSLFARDQARWTGRRLILSGQGRLAIVDLKTLEAHLHRIPYDEDRQ